MYQNLTKEEVLKMDRETLIEVLEWNDRNGTYNDEDSISEGFQPITKEEAIETIIKQFEF